jgi:tetratricopeptide (TPR) repeat protein
VFCEIEVNWFERHLNWTMVLALVGVYGVNFINGLMAGLSAHYVSYFTWFDIGLMIISLAILALVWGWALRRKNRSLWWLPLGLFVPFGFIVLLCLENKSLIHDASASSIADYNKPIELARDNADAYYKRGNDYYEMGEYSKAIADYDKAIELRPNHLSAYYNRGLAYRKKGEVPKAVSDLEKFIGLSTDPELTKAAEQALSEMKYSP